MGWKEGTRLFTLGGALLAPPVCGVAGLRSTIYVGSYPPLADRGQPAAENFLSASDTGHLHVLVEHARACGDAGENSLLCCQS